LRRQDRAIEAAGYQKDYGLRRKKNDFDYTLDKMRPQDFYNRIIAKNQEREEQKMIQRAINNSLECDVKLKYKQDHPDKYKVYEQRRLSNER